MDHKGVSPLIATIILIAMVVAIAGIASQFLTGFQQSRQAEISREGEKVVECSLASIEIDPDSVNFTLASTALILTIENTGRTDLVVREIVYSNTSTQIRENRMATRRSDSTQITTSSPFKEGAVLTIHNTSVSTRPDKIIVTTNCPGVTASVENDTADTNKFIQVFD